MDACIHAYMYIDKCRYLYVYIRIHIKYLCTYMSYQVAKFVLRGVKTANSNANGFALASGKINLAVS